MSQFTLKYPISPAITALLDGIRAAGGRPLLVGGWVRDALMGVPPKDMDIEVFGLEVARLKSLLAKYGQVFAVGVSFGVLKVYLHPDKSELDVSVPRRESKSGQRGWIIEPDPTMTLPEAAARRDFTINAMAYDPATDEILDLFKGVDDLKAGILRHVGPAFAEDPLRVLRAMQFAARWNFSVAPETIELCAGLRTAYGELALMRIWGEWQKWAEKGLYPSAGLKVLEQTGWRSCYPGLEALAMRLYGETTAWEHTLGAVNAMSVICQAEELAEEERLILMLSALCHRLDLPNAVDLAETGRFLSAINCPLLLARQVKHLVLGYLNYRGAAIVPTVEGVRRLSLQLAPATIEQWVRLVKATKDNHGEQAGLEWLRLARQENCAGGPIEPLLQGRHLQEAGLKPGPHFKKLLSEALEAQLSGTFSSLPEAQVWLQARLAENSSKNLEGEKP